jgi:hypothetical protein
MPDNSARKIVTNEDLAEEALTRGVPRSGLTYSQVAQVCYEANRALAAMYGEERNPYGTTRRGGSATLCSKA